MINAFTTSDIDRLVRLVLEDLGAVSNRSATPSLNRPVNVPAVPASAPASVSTPTAASSEPAAPPSDVLEIRLTDRVISLATIKKAEESSLGRRAKKVVVSSGAVVTPSVRDEIKKRHWELIFEAGSPAATAPKVSPKPAAAISTAYRARPIEPTGASPLMVAFHLLPVETLPKSLLDSLGKRGAMFQSGCVIETAQAVERYLTETSGAKGVVLTAYPAIASAILNRRRAIRALIGVEPQRMEEESAELGANVLILDPKRTGFYALQRMIRRFAAFGAAECPAVLKRGLE